jgi:hypothetical protein
MLGFSRLKSKGNGGLGFPKPPLITLDVLVVAVVLKQRNANSLIG